DLVAHSYDDVIVLKHDVHEVTFRQRVEGGGLKDVGDDVRDWEQVASSVGGRVNQIDHHPLSTSREIRSHALEHSLHDVGQCCQRDLLVGRHRECSGPGSLSPSGILRTVRSNKTVEVLHNESFDGIGLQPKD